MTEQEAIQHCQSARPSPSLHQSRRVKTQQTPSIMAVAPPVQLPFCREDEQNQDTDSAADAIIGRLVAKVAQLEEQLYAHELQDSSLQGVCLSAGGCRAWCSIDAACMLQCAASKWPLCRCLKPFSAHMCRRRQCSQLDVSHRGVPAALLLRPGIAVQHGVRRCTCDALIDALLGLQAADWQQCAHRQS